VRGEGEAKRCRYPMKIVLDIRNLLLNSPTSPKTEITKICVTNLLEEFLPPFQGIIDFLIHVGKEGK
jgi:hypothetical protein